MKQAVLCSLFIIYFFHFTSDALAQSENIRKPLRTGYSIPIGGVTAWKMNESKAAGIECIETSLNEYINKTDLTFNLSDDEIKERLKKAKKAAEDAGIEIWSVHMPYGEFIDISLANEKARLKVIALHKKVLGLCRILEPKIILFHPSWYLGLNGREVRKSQMITSAVQLNKSVKKIGARMVIENMLGPELLVSDGKRERPLCRTVEETLQLMGQLPDDIYSAVDMNHIKNPENLIRALGQRLKSVHVADGTGMAENHYFPCSGQGENNWTEILAALEETGYSGPFMFESAFKEVKDIEDCHESLYKQFIAKYPRNLLKK